jgi:hypothetical protein
MFLAGIHGRLLKAGCQLEARWHDKKMKQSCWHDEKMKQARWHDK